MRPIWTERTNFTYLAPGGMADCDPLPCTKEADGRTISVWEPTDDERRAIAAGQNIELHVWQQPPAPVGLALTPAKAIPRPTADLFPKGSRSQAP